MNWLFEIKWYGYVVWEVKFEFLSILRAQWFPKFSSTFWVDLFSGVLIALWASGGKRKKREEEEREAVKIFLWHPFLPPPPKFPPDTREMKNSKICLNFSKCFLAHAETPSKPPQEIIYEFVQKTSLSPLFAAIMVYMCNPTSLFPPFLLAK